MAFFGVSNKSIEQNRKEMRVKIAKKILMILIILLTMIEFAFLIEIANFISCETQIYQTGYSFADHGPNSFHIYEKTASNREKIYSSYSTYKSQIDVYRFVGLLLG